MEDPFQTIPFRHIGHGFAIAEALRFNFESDASDLCATLATAYIVCHAGYRGFQTRRGKLTLSTLFDTLLYDGLASALVPTFVTYHICQLTASILKSIGGAPPIVINYGPLVVGLLTLLVTWESIDIGVNDLMNDTVRIWY